MSLASQVDLLATRVGQEIKAVRTETVASTAIVDIVTISQAAYDALGAGVVATRMYLITS